MPPSNLFRTPEKRIDYSSATVAPQSDPVSAADGFAGVSIVVGWIITVLGIFAALLVTVGTAGVAAPIGIAVALSMASVGLVVTGVGHCVRMLATIARK